jgi:glycosyltransferase involved in cell wall biosynthesis
VTAQSRTCRFLIPGDWLSRTGGYRYDRRIVSGLADLGWAVHRIGLDAGFPRPTTDALHHAEAAVKAIPDGAITVVDGLAFGAMPQIVQRHAQRLAWVALVHHPLWLETGLPAPVAERLRVSETESLRHARRVITTSESTAEAVAAMGVAASRIEVVVPGTDPAPLAAGRATGSATGSAPCLLCIATLTPRKGHRVLIEALAGLRDVPWRLRCLGSLTMDADCAARVREAIAAAGLADRVSLEGEADDAAMSAAYAAADVFVLPSFHEGYGMVLAEALARGLPIVATTAGAIPNTVPADAGTLVPPGDAGALRNALANLLHPAQGAANRTRLAIGARRARTLLPTWPAVCRRFAAALEGV